MGTVQRGNQTGAQTSKEMGISDFISEIRNCCSDKRDFEMNKPISGLINKVEWTEEGRRLEISDHRLIVPKSLSLDETANKLIEFRLAH